jgi:hypothetical protein
MESKAMGKRETVLDWQLLEDGAPGPPSVPAPARISRPQRLPRRWQRWTLAILLALLLPVLVEGYREVHRADQKMARVEDEVRAAVTADAWIEQHQGEAVKTAGLAHPDPEIV